MYTVGLYIVKYKTNAVVSVRSVFDENIDDLLQSRYWDMFVRYSETWELGSPKGLRKSVLYSEVVLFLRSNFTY